MSFLYAIAGATLLIVAGDALVRGAIALSLRLGLSIALISLTVVAFGTSAPELVISVQAALEGSPDIALGNVVGSNVANILLVLGVPAMIVPIAVGGSQDVRNYMFMIGASFLLLAIAWIGIIGRGAALIMLGLLVGFLFDAWRRARGSDFEDDEIDTSSGAIPTPKMAALLIFGLVGLPIGAHFLIEGAREIALSIGVSEAAIGLTLVALGTSLPELAASVAAAWRGRTEVALGNVIGSNLLNILAILSVTSLVSPIPISRGFAVLDIPIMVGVSLLLLPFVLTGKAIGKAPGALLVVLYAVFVALVVIGN
jgi:cation:H+ antiporter